MTYRNGAYVVDIRDNRIAQVTGATGNRVQVQRPGGGLAWEAPAPALRLATREERNAAGLRAYLSGCAECAELEEAWRQATDGERRQAGAEARAHWIVAHATVRENA
ncbi:hypothetical protein AB0F13_02955 [Streptomyces sp. NPDC026206]|uniref:hypothetical protein n=1 Tax=Streptomyces sp. NPDC026206 TaxID=3157089 RepID=UPI0034012BC6